MAEHTTPQRTMSVEEYLAFERNSSSRHELVGGLLHAMAGTSVRHSIISDNTFTLLRAAQGHDCRIHQSDVRVWVPEELFYYPDVIVACGPMPDDPHVEEAPCLIVEVLSPGMESVDRREKLIYYRTLQSLATYLIIEHDVRSVKRYYRDNAGQWQSEVITEGVVPVPCPPNASLTIDAIYEGAAV